MAFEETREQQQTYLFLRLATYLILALELIVNTPIVSESGIFNYIIDIIKKINFFNNIIYCKFGEIICILIVCSGTVAKKSLNFNLKKMVVLPLAIGFTLMILSLIVYIGQYGPRFSDVPLNRWIYALFSVVSLLLINQGLDSLAKYFNSTFGKDRFNFENESFQQTEQLVKNEYSVNIPMLFYWKKKLHKGWINITNPFRGTIVLGTPGSGKSFGIIDPFIRQHAAKGFTMMVYDYKFPTLAKNLFYQYQKNKKKGTLPAGCKFHVVNFADVEYSNRINPIQRKYIPDLAAASETAATLLAALNKGGGEKKGGSEAFFTNSAENFLASIIYFFINYHPCGYYKGEKLNHFISVKGKRLQIKIYQRNMLRAYDENGEIVLNFTNNSNEDVSTDEDGMFFDLKGFYYYDINNQLIIIDDEWWEDVNGNKRVPDTFTGEYSDMPHVLSFLSRSYDEIFNILMDDEKIASLMAPFASAHKNKANDQLEGMVGTLRVNAARLVSPEAYWIFSGDDFDLKISDKNNPAYLVIANDPEKEEVIGSLNALVLNRLTTRVNSKGNHPVSIIIDELPTLYFHKIDRLIGTARSNKVAVTLGFQELPQLEADYGKVGMHKIISTCANIFMGAARNKETLEWAQNDVFGKVKQTSNSVQISDHKVSHTINEKMDFLIPASKIADMATGWLAGQSARDFNATHKKMLDKFDIETAKDFETSKYFCKTNFNMKEISNEEKAYVDLPKFYDFGDAHRKEVLLNRNFRRINNDVDQLIKELL